MSFLTLKQLELTFLCLYALVFYAIFLQRSFQLSQGFIGQLRTHRVGWLYGYMNDLSDSQWRNFRGNLLTLTMVMCAFLCLVYVLRHKFQLKRKGMAIVWIIISLTYLLYLHGACTSFIIVLASINYLIVKLLGQSKYCIGTVWIFNISVLVLNRIYEGYSFSAFGSSIAFLDNYRGTFRWHICFNFVVLRMISFGCDYHWAFHPSLFDGEKHRFRCNECSSGKSCYTALQERALPTDKYTFDVYLCYLLYAPVYIAGPIISFNAFANQLEGAGAGLSFKQISFYGLRWVFSFFIMEMMTRLFFYNAIATSGLWWQLSPLEIFIIGYGVLNFMWLKFLLIWRYFRLCSLIGGIDTPENMPKCINNCYSLESFWKSWHASYNKWLVRYIYIPLGGSKRKLLSIWVIFTFVAVWHDLEWKLISWAWLTCLFMVPEIIIKSLSSVFQARSGLGGLVHRELSAVAGAVTISCLMVANLVGYVVGPSGIKLLVSRMMQRDAMPVLAYIFASFYVGVKLMFHIRDAKSGTQ